MNNSMTLVSGVAAVLRLLRRHTLPALAAVPLVAASAYAYDATGYVTAEAKRQGVPVKFALYMARIESGVRCNNHNRKSSATGPLQVLRGTARAMGYKGDIRRASCATQTRYGMKHLAMCYRGARGNQALAKRCHQVGVSVLYRKKSKRR
jgi:soluble lytic murein transglycosylase-like protein